MIVVTGATGQLGRLVIEELKNRVPTSEIVAAVRSTEKAADLGVEVRELDYNRPETLKPALYGASKVLLISGNEFGRRVAQHAAVVDAAREAGATLIYTSAPKADTTAATLAVEHLATERHIQSSGVTYTILRNGWYHENYAQAMEGAVAQGALVGSAQDGRIASAARADYAAAAAAVLAGDGHDGKIYELSGDAAWTMDELAAEIATVTGTPVGYRDLPVAEYTAILESAGLPADFAPVVADVDVNIARGWLADASGTLSGLSGRPTQPIGEYVRALLKPSV